MPRNPFTPSFGVSPPLLAGRDAERDAFVEALEDGPGSPGRAILFTGVRGSGKTVMLNAIEDEARRRGWLVISETARPGIAAEVAGTALPALLAEHDPGAVISRTTGWSGGVGVVSGGVDREHVDQHSAAPSLRSQLAALTEVLVKHETGVLLTIDEVHTAAITDLRVIAQAVQHCFREGRDLAFVAAGLPSAVEDVLNDHVMTFLRRAERYPLGEVPVEDVKKALREPIEHAGRRIDNEALEVAAAGTRGYPFLVQLVGHQTWVAAGAAEVVDASAARSGVDRAARRVGDLVHAPALRSLSTVDRSFLAAMAVDHGPSRMQDVASRLGVDANYASQYRLRLIAAEMIESAGHGRVTFTLPYLRDYLRAHATSFAFDEGGSRAQP